MIVVEVESIGGLAGSSVADGQRIIRFPLRPADGGLPISSPRPLALRQEGCSIG
jgi:hypothetical protein